MAEYSSVIPIQVDHRRWRVQLIAAAIVWATIVGGVLAWILNDVENVMMQLARKEAVAHFTKDEAFRKWGAKHGGVYVPISEHAEPDPYISHLPYRDITTVDGKELTLINPASMLLQIMQDYDELYGLKGRLVSQTPLNPLNLPDAWEAGALEAFSQGAKEKFEINIIDGEPFMRLIQPMRATEGCLKCHIDQGFKLGDILGAVGVSVPLASYNEVAAERKQRLWLMFGIVWAMGMGAIWVAGRYWQQRIKERIGYEERIWHKANIDGLTGIPNRSLFMDRLEQAISQARRDENKVALLFVDLDGFKDVNDTRGHEVGDRLLQEAARRIQTCVRDSDSVSRLGGDEFTIILPGITKSASATMVASKVLHELSLPYLLDNRESHLSASIGITLFPQDGDNAGTLLRNADTAMYRAKDGGRNYYSYFTWEMNQEAQARVELEESLRRAIKNKEFELHYQPLANISTGKLIGAEALIRWQSPEQGLIPPDQFIPLAEESGLIVPIGEWVLNQAAEDFDKWAKQGLCLESLSVNVSTVQFRSTQFAAKLQKLLIKHTQLSSRLNLEITENIFMDDRVEPGKQLRLFKKLGVKIAIDDFGTGYSSLGYLKRFPVDIVKIDRSFVNDVTSDPEDAALCEAIIAMANHLNLTVVAEGIETQDQLEFLRNSGCSLAQGYYFSQPIPASEFSGLMNESVMTESLAG